ncbi:Kinesin-II 95 kDa subunit [Pelomyxa schiedti]|nr:Kinesin-II 95 kDa subunit [Pelomyxa schiedti]
MSTTKTDKSERVQVVVRCRPMTSKEVTMKCRSCVDVNKLDGSITITRPDKVAGYNASNPKSALEEFSSLPKTKSFTFDSVYGPESTQREIYEETAAQIIDAVFKGFNGTIFAYGQTGSGKTWTMEGKPTAELQGIMPNAFDHIFNKIILAEQSQYLVRASYLEIYNDEVSDLLAKNQPKLEVKQLIHENGNTEFYAKGKSEVDVSQKEELDRLLEIGHSHRHVAETLMNDRSSRSHAIFIITVECSTPGPTGKPIVTKGVLNMVDLAGSERQKKTQAEGDVLKQGAKINLSLSALANVISALVAAKDRHIPYRDSQLTKLLMHSLGGSCKTVMIANLSPADYNFEESLTTLRYAHNAKDIKNTPTVNANPKDVLISEYQAIVKKLQDEIAARRSGIFPSPSGSVPGTPGVEGISPDLLQDLQKETESEVSRILQEKGYAEEEINRIQDQLKHVAAITQQQQRERADLEAQLRKIQQKLSGGGTRALIDENRRQKALLQQHRLQLEAKQMEELRLRRQVQSQRQQVELLVDKCTDLTSRRDNISKSLKTLYAKYVSAKQEISDLQEEFQRDREYMNEEIRKLTSALQLKMIIVSSFIPKHEVEKIKARAQWDDEKLTWKLLPLKDDPKTLEITRNLIGRPKISPATQPVKFTLDMPSRHTQDYTEPPPSLRNEVQSVVRELATPENMPRVSAESFPSVVPNTKKHGKS